MLDVILLIVGVFLIFKGQIQVSQKSNPWPENKKTGRIIGGVLMLLFILIELTAYFKK